MEQLRFMRNKKMRRNLIKGSILFNSLIASSILQSIPTRAVFRLWADGSTLLRSCHQFRGFWLARTMSQTENLGFAQMRFQLRVVAAEGLVLVGGAQQ